MMIIACVICVVATIPLVVEAWRRVRKESSALTWTLLVLSLLWCVIFVCGALRIHGVLPPVNDELGMREITNFLGDYTVLATVGVSVCALVADLFLWIFVRRITTSNMMWWICGSLVAFLAVVFVVACAAYVYMGGAYSLDTMFFGGCCASMALPGWALGLTYKQICVIVNIYLEGALCLFSALWLVAVVLRRVRGTATIGSHALTATGVVYATAYIIAFIVLVLHYAPPLDAAFDKCFNELMASAKEQNTTYNIVNYVLFIAVPLLLVVVNSIVGHIIKVKTNK